MCMFNKEKVRSKFDLFGLFLPIWPKLNVLFDHNYNIYMILLIIF